MNTTKEQRDLLRRLVIAEIYQIYQFGDVDPIPDLSGSFHKTGKKVRKTFISTIFEFLSLKTDVNVSSKSNKQKTL
jgi:hypothetical protein